MKLGPILRLLLPLFAAFLALGAQAQGWTFDLPPDWTVTWKADEKDKTFPPAAILRSNKERAAGQLTVRQGPKVAAWTVAEIDSIPPAMADSSVRESREGRAEVRSFGPGNVGRYTRLTDKDSKAEFKYSNYAILRKGDAMVLAVVFSNDDDGAMLPKIFKMMESFAMGGNAAPAPNASARGKKPAAAQAIAWGAIATDVTPGEVDPYYGIGEGDSQAEAEKSALGSCREAGAKRCAVRLAYNQCGAYALSGSSSGTGVAASQAEAEKLALAACKNRSCVVVTSDCN